MAIRANVTLSVNTSNAERSMQRAAAQINKITGGLSKNQVNFNVNGKSFTQPLGRITASANEFTKSLEASNARVIAFGASVGIINGITDSFKYLIAETVRFEKTLKDINVVLNTSNQQLERFGQGLFDVAQNTAQGFNVAAEAALEFSRQGLSTAEVLKRTNDALTLTRITSLDAAEAVSGLTAAVNAFGKAGLTTTDIIDKLAAVDVKFAVSSEDLVNGLERAGAVAIDAGVSLDSLIAIITSLQQTTARGGAVIGNGLKTIFTRIQRPESIKQLERMDVAVRDLTGSVLPADRILKNIAKSFKNLSQAQQSNIVQFSAGIFQANIFRAALTDLAKAQGIQEQALGVSANAAGEAARKNELLNKSISALASRAGTGLQELVGIIGELAVKDDIGSWLDVFGKSIEGLKNSLGGGEDEGNAFAKGLVRGIGNVLTGPGMVAFTVIFVKLLANVFKFAGASLKDVMGIVSEKEKIKKIEESIVKVLGSNKDLTESLNELEGDRLAQEKFILGMIERQTNALAEQEKMARRLAPGMHKAGIGEDLSFTDHKTGQSVDLDGDGLHSARGVNPIAKTKERREALEAGYSPGPVAKTKIQGIGDVIYNKAETIKQFPGMKQPAIMPPESSRAGETYKRSFAERHGFDPYAGRGFVPNYATISNDMRDQGPSGMKLFVSPGFTTKGRPPPKSWDVQSNLAEFDVNTSTLKGGTWHNLGEYLEALGYNKIQTKIPLDYWDVPTTPRGRMTKEAGDILGGRDTALKGKYAEGIHSASSKGAGMKSTSAHDKAVVDNVGVGVAPHEVKAMDVKPENIVHKSILRYSNKAFRNAVRNIAGAHLYDDTENIAAGMSNHDIATNMIDAINKIEEDSIVKNLGTLARMQEFSLPGMSHEDTMAMIYKSQFRGAVQGSGPEQMNAFKSLLSERGLSDGFVPNFTRPNLTGDTYQIKIRDKHILKKVIELLKSKKKGDQYSSYRALAAEAINSYDSNAALKELNSIQEESGIDKSARTKALPKIKDPGSFITKMLRIRDGKGGTKLGINNDEFDFLSKNLKEKVVQNAKGIRTSDVPEEVDKQIIDGMIAGDVEPLEAAQAHNIGKKSKTREYLKRFKEFLKRSYPEGYKWLEKYAAGTDFKNDKELAEYLGKEGFQAGESKPNIDIPSLKDIKTKLKNIGLNHPDVTNWEAKSNVNPDLKLKGLKQMLWTHLGPNLIKKFKKDDTSETWPKEVPYDITSTHGGGLALPGKKGTHYSVKSDGFQLNTFKIFEAAKKELQGHFKKNWEEKAKKKQIQATIIAQEYQLAKGLIPNFSKSTMLYRGTSPRYEKILGDKPNAPQFLFDDLMAANTKEEFIKAVEMLGMKHSKGMYSMSYNWGAESATAKQMRGEEKLPPGTVQSLGYLYKRPVKGDTKGASGFVSKTVDEDIARHFAKSSHPGLEFDPEHMGQIHTDKVPNTRIFNQEKIEKYIDKFGLKAVQRAFKEGMKKGTLKDVYLNLHKFRPKKQSTDPLDMFSPNAGEIDRSIGMTGGGLTRDEREITQIWSKNSPYYGEARGLVPNFVRYDKSRGGAANWRAIPDNANPNGIGGVFTAREVEKMRNDGWARTDKKGWHFVGGGRAGVDRVEKEERDARRKLAEAQGAMRGGGKMIINNQTGEIFHGTDHHEIAEDNNLYDNGGLPFHFLKTHMGTNLFDSRVDGGKGGFARKMFVNLRDKRINPSVLAKLKEIAEENAMVLLRDDFNARDREGDILYDSRGVLGNKVLSSGFVPNFFNIKDKNKDRKKLLIAWQDKLDAASRLAHSGRPRAEIDPQISNLNAEANAIWNQIQQLKSKGFVPNFADISKIRELAIRGRGGEKTNAQRMLKKFSIQSKGMFDDMIIDDFLRNPSMSYKGPWGDTVTDYLLSKGYDRDQILRAAKKPGSYTRAGIGLIPNFSDPLGTAIGREKAAGVPESRIRVAQDDSLRDPKNPMGLAVINTKDEPFGISQGIRRARESGIDPKKHGAAQGLIPNFASGGDVPSFDGLNQELDKIIAKGVEGFKNVSKEMEDYYDDLHKLANIDPTNIQELNARLDEMKISSALLGDSISELEKRDNKTKDDKEHLKNLKKEKEKVDKTIDAVEDKNQLSGIKNLADFEQNFERLMEIFDRKLKEIEEGSGSTGEAGKHEAILKEKTAAQIKEKEIIEASSEAKQGDLQKLFFMSSAIQMLNGQFQEMGTSSSFFVEWIGKAGEATGNFVQALITAKEVGGQAMEAAGVTKETSFGLGDIMPGGDAFNKDSAKRRAHRKAEMSRSRKAGPGKMGGLGKLMKGIGGLARGAMRFIPILGQLYTGFTLVNEAFKMFTGDGVSQLWESAADRAAKQIEKLGKAAESGANAIDAIEKADQAKLKVAELELLGDKRTVKQDGELWKQRMELLKAQKAQSVAIGDLTDKNKVGKDGVKAYSKIIQQSGGDFNKLSAALKENQAVIQSNIAAFQMQANYADRMDASEDQDTMDVLSGAHGTTLGSFTNTILEQQISDPKQREEMAAAIADKMRDVNAGNAGSVNFSGIKGMNNQINAFLMDQIKQFELGSSEEDEAGPEGAKAFVKGMKEWANAVEKGAKDIDVVTAIAASTGKWKKILDRRIILGKALRAIEQKTLDTNVEFLKIGRERAGWAIDQLKSEKLISREDAINHKIRLKKLDADAELAKKERKAKEALTEAILKQAGEILRVESLADMKGADLPKAMEKLSKGIDEAIRNISSKDVLADLNKGLDPKDQITATSRQKSIAQGMLGRLRASAKLGNAEELQQVLTKVFEDLEKQKSNVVNLLVMQALGVSNAIALDEEKLKNTREAILNQVKTSHSNKEEHALSVERMKTEWKKKQLEENTLAGAKLRESIYSKMTLTAGTINRDLMGEAENLKVINKHNAKRAKLTKDSVHYQAVIVEGLKREAQEKLLKDQESSAKAATDAAMLGALVDPRQGLAGINPKTLELMKIQGDIIKEKTDIEVSNKIKAHHEAKARNSFLTFYNDRVRLAEATFGIEKENQEDEILNNRKTLNLLKKKGKRNDLAERTIILESQALQKEGLILDGKLRYSKSIHEMAYIASLHVNNELKQLKWDNALEKRKLSYLITSGKINEIAKETLESETLGLEKEALMLASKNRQLINSKGLEDRQKKAQELLDVQNKLQELKNAEMAANIDQMALNAIVDADMQIRAFDQRRGTRQAATSAVHSMATPEDMLSFAESLKEYNKTVGKSTGAIDQLRVKMAEMSVSASNLGSDLVDIGIEGARSGMVELFKSIGSGAEDASEAWKKFSLGIAESLLDRIMQHNVDKIINDLSYAFTGVDPEKDAHKFIKDNTFHIQANTKALVENSKKLEAAVQENVKDDFGSSYLGKEHQESREDKIARRQRRGFMRGYLDSLPKKGPTGIDLLNKQDEDIRKSQEEIEKAKALIHSAADAIAGKGDAFLSDLTSTVNRTLDSATSRIQRLVAAIAVAEERDGIQTELDMANEDIESNKNELVKKFEKVIERKTEKIWDPHASDGFMDDASSGGAYRTRSWEETTYDGDPFNTAKAKDVTEGRETLKKLLGPGLNLEDIEKILDYNEKTKGEIDESFIELLEARKEILTNQKQISEKLLIFDISEKEVSLERLRQEMKDLEADEVKDAEKEFQELENSIRQAKNELRELHAEMKKFHIQRDDGGPTAGASAPGSFWGGRIQKFAEGGFVNGPAGKDKVPAMLTAGEYVVPKDEVQKFNNGTGRSGAGSTGNWWEEGIFGWNRSNTDHRGVAGAQGLMRAYVMSEVSSAMRRQKDDKPPEFDMKKLNQLDLKSDVSMKRGDPRLTGKFLAKDPVMGEYKSHLLEKAAYDVRKRNEKFQEKQARLRSLVGVGTGAIFGAAWKDFASPAIRKVGDWARSAGDWVGRKTENTVKGHSGLGRHSEEFKKARMENKPVDYRDIDNFYKNEFDDLRNEGINYSNKAFYNAIDSQKTLTTYAYRNSRLHSIDLIPRKNAFSSGSGPFDVQALNIEQSKNFPQQNRGGPIPSMLTAGEGFIPAPIAKRIGYGNLDVMNKTGSLPTVQGPGGIDKVGPVGLSEGDFIIRKSSTDKLMRENPNMMRFALQNPDGFRRGETGYYEGGIVGTGDVTSRSIPASSGSAAAQPVNRIQPLIEAAEAQQKEKVSHSQNNEVTNNINVNVTIDGSGNERVEAESPQGSYEQEQQLAMKIKSKVLEVIREEKRLGGELDR